MSQDDDLVFKKDLSEERIHELEAENIVHRYNRNCVVAAIIGMIIAVFAGLLLGISLGAIYIIVTSLGAACGYVFYAMGQYLQKKHENDRPLEYPLCDENDKKTPQKNEPDSRPLCPGYLEPVDPLNYYCPKCGEAGQLTPYIPFVNIRFNYSIFGRLWCKIWHEKTSLLMKVISAIVILLFTPIMLVGLPFVIWDKMSGSKTQNKASLQEKEEEQG